MRGGHPRRGAAEARSRARPAWERERRRPRSVSTDICNPQDSFSTTNTFVSVHSGSHYPRDPGTAVSRRRPASAIRAPARVISSAHTPHGVPLTSLSLVLRAVGTSPAPACRTNREPTIGAPRETADHPGDRLQTPSTPLHLPPATDGIGRSESRALELHGAEEIARAMKTSLCSVNRPAGTSRVPPVPAPSFTLLAESLLFRGARADSARPKPPSPSVALSTRGECCLGSGAPVEQGFEVPAALRSTAVEPRSAQPSLPHSDILVTAARPSKDGSSSASSRRSRPARPAKDDRPDAFHRRTRKRAGARSRGHLTLSSKAARLFDRRSEAP